MNLIKQCVSRLECFPKSVKRFLDKKYSKNKYLERLTASIKIKATLVLFLAMVGFVGHSAQAEGNDVLNLHLKDGIVAIELRGDLAPLHVEQIKKLVSDGAYDNVAFHRVINGFMAQTGDVEYGRLGSNYDANRAGTGGSKYGNIKAEFSSQPFRRGTVGMARSQNPDSANSQFFICFGDAPHLNGQYTVVGEVVKGMEFVDKIKKGAQDRSGTVDNPDVIIKASLAATVQ